MDIETPAPRTLKLPSASRRSWSIGDGGQHAIIGAYAAKTGARIVGVNRT
jgi:hypothetical protein